MTATKALPPITVIRPRARTVLVPVADVRERRELLAFLVWRDLKIRYKQTFLGAAWALLQPLSAMVIFGLFFGRLAGIGAQGAPYWLFALAGVVPWIYFANALSQSGMSLVDNERIIAKVYFPRFLLPLSPVLAGLAELAIASTLLIVVGSFAVGLPGPALLTLPLFALLAAATAGGLGLVLSCLNVRYRDVRYVLPFLVQLLMFASPVVYGSAVIPEGWRLVHAANPLVSVIDGFRWAVLDQAPPSPGTLAMSVLAATTLLLGGSYVFHRNERSFADVL